jgi:hypothetical protein
MKMIDPKAKQLAIMIGAHGRMQRRVNPGITEEQLIAGAVKLRELLKDMYPCTDAQFQAIIKGLKEVRRDEHSN